MRLIEDWEIEVTWEDFSVDIFHADNESEALKIANNYEMQRHLLLDDVVVRRVRHYQFIDPITSREV